MLESKRNALNENWLVNRFYKDIQKKYDINKFMEWFRLYDANVERLYHCNAEIVTTENYVFLRSYETIISAIDINDHVCYDFLRLAYDYTNTSAQHQRKFETLYNDWFSRVYRYRDINLSQSDKIELKDTVGYSTSLSPFDVQLKDVSDEYIEYVDCSGKGHRTKVHDNGWFKVNGKRVYLDTCMRF